MPILVILGIAGVAGFLALHNMGVAIMSPRASNVAPTSPRASAQPTLQSLETQIQALTPRPIDPLAPKVAPVAVAGQYAAPIWNFTPSHSAQDALIEAKATETNLNPKDFSVGQTLKSNPTQLEKNMLNQIWSMHSAAWDYRTGFVPDWYNAQHPKSNDLALVGAGTGMGLAVAGNITKAVGSSISQAIPFIGTAISTIIGIFGIISAHHNAALQRDATAWNVSTHSVENYLNIIRDAVNNGQSTPEEGINALDSMYADFLAYTAPARNNHPYANSVTEVKISTQALVIYWKAAYNELVIRGNGGGRAI